MLLVFWQAISPVENIVPGITPLIVPECLVRGSFPLVVICFSGCQCFVALRVIEAVRKGDQVFNLNVGGEQRFDANAFSAEGAAPVHRIVG